MKKISAWLITVFFLTVFGVFGEKEAVKLASLPALSPDGQTLVFEYRHDLWQVSSGGGEAKRLTQHPAFDTRPVFSPDGKKLAFMSNRDDTWQTYIMSAHGGTARQITFHSDGSTPLDWFPDGKSILVRGYRDSKGYIQSRFYKVSTEKRVPEELVFDAFGIDANISHNGSKLLFTRMGAELYRKGYNGSLASRIWLRDFKNKTFTKICSDPSGNRSPLWKPDDSGLYYVCQRDGCFNVWEHTLKKGKDRQLTHFKDASVIIPTLSRDGSTMVFRQLFDFYRMDPREPASLEKLDIWINIDNPSPPTRRRYYTTVWNNNEYGSVNFTDDGLETCFAAGGDVWVMDTVLRNPKCVCGETATHESEAVFSPDGNSIYFLRDNGLGVNIWRAERKNPAKYWWENDEFILTPLTNDRLSRFNLEISPAGDRLSIIQNSFELWTYDIDCTNGRMVMKSPFEIYYDWSPDGHWFSATTQDSWGNSDIWIVAEDNSRQPFNLSRHHEWDGNARWSPDGRIIAFTGRRNNSDVDIFYVYLKNKDDTESKRTRRVKDALETMRKARKTHEEKHKGENDNFQEESSMEKTQTTKLEPAENNNESREDPVDPKIAESDNHAIGANLQIDFDHLSERIHRISLHGAVPSNLFWGYDSKALAFKSEGKGNNGTYKIIFPDGLTPVFMTNETGEYARWVKNGNKILWRSGNLPATYTRKHPFKAFQETNISQYKRLGFRIIWRELRDRFYDPAMNNLNWEEIRLKYEDMAAESIDWDSFERVINMLNGELNASHLGFEREIGVAKEWKREYSSGQWKVLTAHTGLRFKRTSTGSGLLIESIIPGGPADTEKIGIKAGDTVLRINNREIQPDTDLTSILNGRANRVVTLLFRRADGEEREVEIETKTYEQMRTLIKKAWVLDMRKKVERLSDGKLGYLNIAEMKTKNLRQFEHEVFACGFGKDGLVIDVRNNPGGIISDHLLSIICHPHHAFTIPRGGISSYQQGYLPDIAWMKPIIVLCNCYTASNAEIFCHAVKTLKRGKIVGTPTQGAVISTSSKNILDIGNMRVPFRGWFTLDGKDMDSNPCEPDFIIQTEPGDIPAGRDPQLEKAVKVLMKEIRKTDNHSKPLYSSEKRRNQI